MVPIRWTRRLQLGSRPVDETPSPLNLQCDLESSRIPKAIRQTRRAEADLDPRAEAAARVLCAERRGTPDNLKLATPGSGSDSDDERGHAWGATATRTRD